LIDNIITFISSKYPTGKELLLAKSEYCDFPDIYTLYSKHPILIRILTGRFEE